MNLIILTGATGSDVLDGALRAVAGLAVPDGMVAEHWIAVDGDDRRAGVEASLDRVAPHPQITRRVIGLPYNTGRDGGAYLCHRIIAAAAFLVPTGWWISVLDEDNALTPDHLCLLDSAQKRVPDARWGYTLRTIVGPEGERVDDSVESTGLIRLTCLGSETVPDRLIDTNCYVVRSDLAKETAPLWGCTTARNPSDVEADRKLVQTLCVHEPKAWCTRHYTVLYTASNREDSVSLDFFLKALRSCPPWDPAKRDIYLFHFDRDKTEVALRGEESPVGEWCPTMFDGIRDAWNPINGFDCLSGLPHDAIVFITLCHPGTLPLGLLRDLKASTHRDMQRILYTAEGPNSRHRDQWTREFLTAFADVVLTYSLPVLRDPLITTVSCPHNSRFLSEDTIDLYARDNLGPDTGTVAMVLEPRTGRDSYTIDETGYTCLDGLRIEVATGFGPGMTVVGQGWTRIVEAMARDEDRPSIGYDRPRFTDTCTPMDTYQKHDFSVILENTDCPGYVSEKVGDSLLAGAIPIYDGRSLHDRSFKDKAFQDAPDLRILREGRGVWWIDLGDVAAWRETRCPDLPLGRALKEYLQANYYATRDIIRIMKGRVRDVRRDYLLAKGTPAIRAALERASSSPGTLP